MGFNCLKARATVRRQFTFTTKIPEIPGTHFIDLGRMKDCIDLGATRVKKVKRGGCSRICVLNPRLIYLNNILTLKYLEFLKIFMQVTEYFYHNSCLSKHKRLIFSKGPF